MLAGYCGRRELNDMCGIVGFVEPVGFNAVEASAVLKNMVEALRHRGPDDSGEWVDGKAGVALGHRRLSIIDLSIAGHQPMASSSGRFLIAFNGEIYNHLELRKKIGAWPWRGHSDTETLLAAIQEWGLDRALQESSGMFALAVWDRSSGTLSLARDRMGEKPLYYGWQGRSFVFASELKALRLHPDFVGDIDRVALSQYVRRGYVPTPRSMFAGIKKLVPGSILQIEANSRSGDLPSPRPYWSLDEIIEHRREQQFKGGADEAVVQFEALLSAAIKQQQIADVPLGAFLSGGIDSSTVVALMQAMAGRPVKTYTIGFKEESYDEAAHARAVAHHLQTEHTELYVTPEDAMEVIPSLPRIYDEPFADISQIPTILVSRLARRDVTVALSGDGGDELFCGYGHYQQTVKSWARLSRIPLPVRSALQQILPNGALAEGIASKNIGGFFQFMNSQWKGFPNLVRGDGHTSLPDSAPEVLLDAKERMMYADGLNYLPDDILVKVDRAAMSTSLETRVPMLDHRVVEFAWRLPIEYKFRDGITKWPLKQVLYQYVPEKLVNRPKMGFGVPLEHWLRGPLKEWAEDLLAEDRLKSEGFFDPAAIRAEWVTHLSGKKNRHYGLWTILMFQSWYDAQRNCAQ